MSAHNMLSVLGQKVGLMKSDYQILWLSGLSKWLFGWSTASTRSTDVIHVDTDNGNVATVAGLTVGSTLGVTGNLAVNTDKFTVTAASGNTVVAGTLGVTGNVAVNTDKLAVTAASGNVVSAGDVKAASFTLSALNTAPAAANSTGTAGTIRIVDGYIYVCTATDTWKRVQLATWT